MSVWDDTTGVSDLLDAARSERFLRNRPCLIVLSGLHIGQLLPLDAAERQVVGRAQNAEIRLVDVGISRAHIAIEPGKDGKLWVEDLGSRNGSYCNGRRIGKKLLGDGDKIQLGRSTMLRFSYVDEFDETFYRLMYNSALRDALTQTYNRRYFNERLDAEFHFARRHKAPLSLLLIDLDHFKLVNDGFGHVAGDRVLTQFAESVQASVRNEDVFARFGGEEFAIISRSISSQEAGRFAERLRAVVERLEIDYEDERIPLTMSIGVASMPELAAATPVELVEAADRALFQAKRSGRNRTHVYNPVEDSQADKGGRGRPTDDTQPL